jgi:hypothetical protein
VALEAVRIPRAVAVLVDLGHQFLENFQAQIRLLNQL